MAGKSHDADVKQTRSKAAKKRADGLFLLAVILTFGSMLTVVVKAVSETTTVNSHGHRQAFTQKVFIAFCLFVGMALSYVMVGVLGLCGLSMSEQDTSGNSDDLEEPSQTDPLVASSSQQPKSYGATSDDELRGVADDAQAAPDEDAPTMTCVQAWWYISIPATLDVTSTLLLFFGLTKLDASVWAMLRGSGVIYSALLSWARFNDHALRHVQWLWLPLAGVVVGLSLIGASAILDEQREAAGEHSSGREAALGIMFVVVGQFFGAGQGVVEQHYQQVVGFDSTTLTSVEGLIGAAVLVVVITPIFWLSGLENGYETLYMIAHNGTLAGLLVAETLLAMVFGWCMVTVAGKLDAVHRSIMSLARGFAVWMIELTIGYAFGSAHSTRGERWGHYDYLQAVGWLLFFGCGLGYNQYVHVYEEEVAASKSSATSVQHSSPQSS